MLLERDQVCFFVENNLRFTGKTFFQDENKLTVLLEGIPEWYSVGENGIVTITNKAKAEEYWGELLSVDKTYHKFTYATLLLTKK